MRGLLTNNKGISMLEALVSVVIVALISLAILGAVTQSALFTEEADKVYTASFLSQGRIDVLRKFEFGDLPDIAPEEDVGIDVNDDGVDDYVRTTEITEEYDSNEHLLKVKVSVDRLVDGRKLGYPIVMETVFVDPVVYD